MSRLVSPDDAIVTVPAAPGAALSWADYPSGGASELLHNYCWIETSQTTLGSEDVLYIKLDWSSSDELAVYAVKPVIDFSQ